MRRAFPGPGAATAAIVSACALLAPWRCSPAWAAPAAKAVAAAEAGRHIGEEATVCGQVAGGTYADRSNGQPTFLDFQRPYPDEVFRVLIWGTDRAKFKQPPERVFAGQQVCAAGRIQLYRGKPEIVVREPSQLSAAQVTPASPWPRLGTAALLVALLLLAAGGLRHVLRLRRSGRLTRIDESLVDPLTGARNRRYFEQVVPAECQRVLRQLRDRAGRARQPERNPDLLFSVVDLDRFKAVNDLYGHRAGDEVLRVVARRLRSALRDTDLLFRWGGDEFLVVCRESPRGDGERVAGRLLEAVRSEPIALGARSEMKVTCSVGWAPFPWFSDAPAALSAEDVLELADRGLYAAKAGGRDRAAGLLPAGPFTPEAVAEIRAGDPGSVQESRGWWRLLRSDPADGAAAPANP